MGVHGAPARSPALVLACVLAWVAHTACDLAAETAGKCAFMETAFVETFSGPTLNSTRWVQASLNGLFHCNKGTERFVRAPPGATRPEPPALPDTARSSHTPSAPWPRPPTSRPTRVCRSTRSATPRARCLPSHRCGPQRGDFPILAASLTPPWWPGPMQQPVPPQPVLRAAFGVGGVRQLDRGARHQQGCAPPCLLLTAAPGR